MDRGVSSNRFPSLEPQEQMAVRKALEEWAAREHRRVTFGDLVNRWSGFVRSVESGYRFSIEEYANDLSTRDVIDDILDLVSDPPRSKLLDSLGPWDRRYLAATRPVSKAVYFRPGAPRERWFRIPTRLVGQLLEDVQNGELL